MNLPLILLQYIKYKHANMHILIKVTWSDFIGHIREIIRKYITKESILISELLA